MVSTKFEYWSEIVFQIRKIIKVDPARRALSATV